MTVRLTGKRGMNNDYGACLIFVATVFNSNDDIRIVHVCILYFSVAYEDCLDFQTCMNRTHTQ